MDQNRSDIIRGGNSDSKIIIAQTKTEEYKQRPS
jgi:hypothetical protein